MLTTMLSHLFAQMSGRNAHVNPAVRRRKNKHTRRHLRQESRMHFEGLEPRVLLSVGVVGVVDWIEQGSQPITQASSVAAPFNPASGAVEDLAVDPNDPSHMFAATVNGGIWRTHDGNLPFNGIDDGGFPVFVDDAFEQPSWTPLTDQFPSLAVNGIAFDPLDPTGNTVFAGTGSASSLSNFGGLPMGIMKTTDDGATWSVYLLNPSGSEPQVRAILPTTYDVNDDPTVTQVVLVGTVGNGLYRSTDAGETYTRISNSGAGLPGGSVTEIVVDPNDDAIYYAGVVGSGVYRSADGGATWASVNNTALSTASLGTSTAVMLTAHAGGGATRVYAMISYDDDGAGAPEVPQVFTSIDGGTNWTELAAVPTGFQSGFGNLYTGMASDQITVDPADQTIVYISKGYGGSPQLLRYNPSGVGSWDNIEVPGIGTRPHVDHRDLLFANSGGNDVLISANDGGLYFLVDPQSPPGGWVGLGGFGATGLGITEYTNVTLDATFDLLFGGAQVNGTSVQIAPGDLVWESFRGADGGDVQAAPAPGGNSYRYAANQPGSSNPNQSPITRYEFSDPTTQVGSPVTLFPAAGLAGFAPRFVAQFELNRINASRLVVGGGGTSPVYELTNADTATGTGDANWVAVPIGTGFSTVNDNDDAAFVVGGRMGGVDNEEVLIVGSGGNVFVRSTAGGTLTNTSTPFPGGNVQAIAVDPENWQHMFVADSDQVWETIDAGATWTEITRNLALINNRIQSLAYVPTPDEDVILVGGNLGVSRLTVGLPDAPWTRFGANLPNALVSDLEYHGGADDMLVAGTFGRGAWIIEDVSTVVDDIGVLQIFGDEDFIGQDDVIRLVRNAFNPLILDVFLNSSDPVFSAPLSLFQQINVFGLEGNDMLELDSTYGLVNVPLGVRFDGGGGFDGLELYQDDGPVHISDTYSVGPDIGSGVSAILGEAPAVGAANANMQRVDFRNLEPVLDLVAAAVLTVNATPSNNAINYEEGAVATNGLVTIDNFESIEFSNKAELVINAGAGQDTIHLGNASTPTGLTNITVNGGDPGSGDVLMLTGSAAAATVNTATAMISGASGAGGEVDIDYSGIESLDLVADIGDLTLTLTSADDTVVVTPGLSTGSNSGTVESSGAVPAISFVNAGVLMLNLAGGDDQLTVNGSSDADTIAVSGAAVVITGRRAVNYSEAEDVTVTGKGGSDTFNVTPSGTVALFIDGGDPVGGLPGDLLNILAGGGAVTYNPGPETDEGSFAVGANQPVSFDHIESFGITGSGPAVINGTNGPDAITVIARDATTHAGADGVQDFTVSVNTGPQLLFIDVADLTINALSGSDQVTVQTPALNNAVWDVDVTVDGGPPAAPGADADRLIVQTPGGGDETVVYTPTAADGGTLDLTSLSSLITLTTMEQLIYDGQGDNDDFTIVGTGGDDIIVHTPGTNNQAGTFAVNDLLAISYQNLGNGGSLTADGGGGTDRFVYHGTVGNDTFLINGLVDGTVKLNARLDITTHDIEELQLEGYDGNDLFNVQTAISASPYTSLYLNGGGEASAAGDRVNLLGTAGDDEIIISGQTVTLGGTTVVGDGIESIQLDALDGDDSLTYDGVSGVTEDITISSSGTEGGGQISVPDVTLVNFQGVEAIDVNGNVPGPTEIDTLTFVGTNAADIFEIHLETTDTDLVPILTLSTVSGTTLLTLRDYTNVETLRVNGLEGTDTFNVYTADTGVSRDVLIDGGTPTGKKKSTDKLYVYYEMPRPKIIKSAETQNPTSGLVDLDYGASRFVVQYDDMEDIVVAKA